MITSISGKIFSFGEDYVDLLVGGFGVRVFVPKNTLGSLGKEGNEVTLLTNFQFRDESLILYGFTNGEMRKAFELLITVNGVGPKAALNILSILNVEELSIAVSSGDVVGLKGVPGIGIKTANRILLELKDKFEEISYLSLDASQNTDLIEALMALGYTRSESFNVVSGIATDEKMSFEDKVRFCVQKLGG
jgi:Holliday junction DNA helicase RuvA|tara:strand:- start:453 stop:1025 length:573 start_codon:yes stop_codon:yes gene_type:complete